jgi:hypothetical protein
LYSSSRRTKTATPKRKAFCKSHGPLDGQVKSIQYLTDNRVPFEPTVCFEFSGAESKVPVLKVEKVEARATWDIDAEAVLKMRTDQSRRDQWRQGPLWFIRRYMQVGGLLCLR